MFTVYIYYFYKLSILNGIKNRYNNKYLILIAITMGANIGISYFIWLFTQMFGSAHHQNIGTIIGVIFQVIQQCVIMISFTCTPKLRQLCKELFSREQ